MFLSTRTYSFDTLSMLLLIQCLHAVGTAERTLCTFVSPARGATLQTFLDRSVLMTELFPTFG